MIYAVIDTNVVVSGMMSAFANRGACMATEREIIRKNSAPR